MRRFFLLIALAAMVATPLIAADAADPMACCKAAGVERTVTNLDNGVKVTMTAKDPKAVAMIQAMSATCCKDCPMGAEGVTRSVEKTSAGVTITATATDPELIKKLQAHAATMTAGAEMKGCCKGKSDAKAMGGKCPYGKSDAKQT